MRHSGLVSLALLILSLWTDLGQGLPRSQATFARDMRGDVMYNVADTGNIAAECIVTLYFSLTFSLTVLFDGLKGYILTLLNFSIFVGKVG